MKKLLLFASLAFCTAGFSQASIDSFVGSTEPTPDDVSSGDGINSRIYYRGVLDTAPDESQAGANISWDFNAVVFGAQESYSNTIASTSEAEEYPGCNFVTTGIDEVTAAEVGKMYAREENGSFIILGNTTDMFSLKFSGDGAFVGLFPMNYGYSANNIVSGTFDYSGPEGNFSGNFTGTVVSTYDAYGTISYDNFDPVPTPVDRLSVIMNLTFGTVDFPDAGTIIQTSHFYYKEPELGLWPLFRSVRNQISVPALSIDRDTTVMERADEFLLLGLTSTRNDLVWVYPNPVKNSVTISGIDNLSEVRVTDMNGRLMLTERTDTIDLSALQSGMYLVQLTSPNGTTVRKIIKE